MTSKDKFLPQSTNESLVTDAATTRDSSRAVSTQQEEAGAASFSELLGANRTPSSSASEKAGQR